MKDWKLTGRLMSFLHKRLKELHLEDVDDPRGKKGQRWQMTVFLRATIAGIISGQKNLKEVEALTTDMTPMVRKLLGLKRRVPDTTMRDCFIRLDPDSLRNILHKMAQVANRRKALLPIGLPGGVWLWMENGLLPTLSIQLIHNIIQMAQRGNLSNNCAPSPVA